MENKEPEYTGVCQICGRCHTNNQSCSQRVANAYLMQPQALEQLTDTDKEWMANHNFNVLAIIEEEVANRMAED